MAPYDSSLATKISPLIEGQVPDFVQADFPLFVKFLEHYYKFLESAQLTISGTVNFVALENSQSKFNAIRFQFTLNQFRSLFDCLGSSSKEGQRRHSDDEA